MFFIGLDVLGHFYSPLAIKILSVESDRSVPEFFQYLKELFVAVMFWRLSSRSKDRSYWSICILFAYIFVDDAFSFHENVGFFLGEALHLKDGVIDAKDVGELLVSAISGVFIFGFIGWRYFRSNTYFRNVVHDVLILFAGLAFFGVVVDTVHSASRGMDYLPQILGLIEDGGEMIMVSLMAIYALLLYRVWPREEPLFSRAIFLSVKRKFLK